MMKTLTSFEISHQRDSIQNGRQTGKINKYIINQCPSPPLCLHLQHIGTHKMRIFEHSDFGGKTMELTDCCPSLYDYLHNNNINSCQVMEGYWVFYEHPNYKGRQYLLRPGEYRRSSEWGAVNTGTGSIRRITYSN